MLGSYIFVRNVVCDSALLYQSSLFVLHLFEKPCDEPLMGGKQTCSLYLVPQQAVFMLMSPSCALSRNPATLGYWILPHWILPGFLAFPVCFLDCSEELKKIKPHTHTPLFLLYILNCVGNSNVNIDVKLNDAKLFFCPVPSYVTRWRNFTLNKCKTHHHDNTSPDNSDKNHEMAKNYFINTGKNTVHLILSLSSRD